MAGDSGVMARQMGRIKAAIVGVEPRCRETTDGTVLALAMSTAAAYVGSRDLPGDPDLMRELAAVALEAMDGWEERYRGRN